MNCVDITLLCVFKKSLSNIYVAFFFKRLECVSASGRTHIALLRHLRNGPKTYAFAVANRNKKTINHKFIWRKVFIKDFVRHIVNLAVGFVIFVCVHFLPPFKLFERIFCRVKTKRKTPFKKTPSTIRRKIQVLLMCFQKDLQIIFTQKEVCPSCRANLIFYIVYPSKIQR